MCDTLVVDIMKRLALFVFWKEDTNNSYIVINTVPWSFDFRHSQAIGNKVLFRGPTYSVISSVTVLSLQSV